MMVRRTGENIPALEFSLLKGGRWSGKTVPEKDFTLLTVYRGMWCPHCKHQLSELDRLYDEFESRAVSVVAVSADTQSRAASMVEELGLKNLRVGYEIPIESARQLGLFVSKGIKEVEMPLFCEPGSFLIDSQARVFAAWIASNAFARTEPESMLAYIDFIKEKKHRAPRGSA